MNSKPPRAYLNLFFRLLMKDSILQRRKNFPIFHAFKVNAEERKKTSKHLFANLDQCLKLIVRENFSPSSCSINF